MKNTLSLFTFLAVAAAVFLTGNASGPGEVQGIDRTGSPLSPGACNTGGCHSGGAFSPSLQVALLDGDEPVEEYEPGKTYTFRLRINAGAGAPAGYGFQAVALTGDDDAFAGAWGDPPNGIQITTIDDRDYAEHSSPSNSNTFEIDWTAPEEGVVRFYAAGNAVNRNGQPTGDSALPLANPLVIQPMAAGIFGVEKLAVDLRVSPVPAVDQLDLRIGGAAPGRYELSLVDALGRPLHRETIDLYAGEQTKTLNLSALPAGHYFVRLSDGRRVAAQAVVKQ